MLRGSDIEVFYFPKIVVSVRFICLLFRGLTAKNLQVFAGLFFYGNLNVVQWPCFDDMLSEKVF